MSTARHLSALLLALAASALAPLVAQANEPDDDALTAPPAPHALAEPADALLPTEADHYTVHTVPLPEDMVLEVGGLAPLPDDALLVCTRRGEVWHVAGASGEDPVFTLWADGLQEPLGLTERDGWIWTAQRGELTRMRDADGDGIGDEFLTVCDDWNISGSYHEYAFGPRFDTQGNAWITLNRAFGDEPFGHMDWRGWAMRISPDGTMEPVCGGLRSPAGIERAPWGDMFYTDNQGEWCGASKLSHLEPGDFHGHPFGMESCKLPSSQVAFPGELPDGVLMPEAAQRIPGFKLPAVWFPYDKTGRSPSGMAWDLSEGGFGPFAGQLFVGDQYGANILRVHLEQVDGVWQGACMRFREDLASGVIRVSFDTEGALWVGMSDRGWPSLGSEQWGLQKLTWTGVVPFEIHTVAAQHEGFRLTFTAPVDAATAADPASYRLESYTYNFQSDYGSDELDRRELTVRQALVAPDRRSVELRVSRLREGYVHEIEAAGVRDTDGRPLLHDRAWYTLQRVPGGRRPLALFIAAEPELRSEETLPVLAELLERYDVDTELLMSVDRSGFVDPAHPSNLPGLRALRDADLVVLAMADRVLPTEQLEHLLAFAENPCSVLALRGSLRPLRYADGPHRHWNETWPERVLGATPAAAHSAGTRTLAMPSGVHPILRGVDPFVSPLPLAGMTPASTDGVLLDLVHGRAIHGRPLLRGGQPPYTARAQRTPILSVRDTGTRRVVTTTLGHPSDIAGTAGRRLLLQAMLWALGHEDAVPPAGCPVTLDQPLTTAPAGLARHRTGLRH